MKIKGSDGYGDNMAQQRGWVGLMQATMKNTHISPPPEKLKPCSS